MNLNADFELRASAHTATMPWVASPMPGVDRRMLDRIGDEVARATSIVRYAPGSAFSPHVHTGGEEFLVLEGVFQDEHGDFAAGSYVRNPPQSSHTPGSAPGCTIFVKLWQFDFDDRTEVKVRTGEHTYTPVQGRSGVEAMLLHEDSRERVCLERWAPETAVSMALPGGAELFVLDGSFEESAETFERHAWLRLPPGGELRAVSGGQGARVWIKTGHLAHVQTVTRPGVGA